ncbi:hypothetical protein AB0L40_03005 [Patulibacter sp. NPDC049589]|uniref:hypothetical protein n=1 Tax=Patulibacter sp. NPDC049589 TaxID=3154731 RepID=UPI00343E1291
MPAPSPEDDAPTARPSPHDRRVLRRGPVLLGGVVLVAAAAVATVALGGTSSDGPASRHVPAATTAAVRPRDPAAPLARSFPPPPDAARHRGTAYVLSGPDLHVGRIGWCTNIGASRRGILHVAISGCGPARTSSPYAAISGSFGKRGANEVAIVDETVRTLRLAGGRRFALRTSRNLPRGWRWLVLQPGDRNGLNDPGTTLLDARGRRIGVPTTDGPWVVPQASRDVPGTAPAGTPCRITARRDLVVRETRVLRAAPVAVPASPGRPYLPCARAELRLGRVELQATVLLDAGRPGRAPAPLPGARRARGTGGAKVFRSVSEDGPRAARRDGTTWMVVTGGTAAQRLRALRSVSTDGLRISRRS